MPVFADVILTQATKTSSQDCFFNRIFLVYSRWHFTYILNDNKGGLGVRPGYKEPLSVPNGGTHPSRGYTICFYSQTNKERVIQTEKKNVHNTFRVLRFWIWENRTVAEMHIVQGSYHSAQNTNIELILIYEGEKIKTLLFIHFKFCKISSLQRVKRKMLYQLQECIKN